MRRFSLILLLSLFAAPAFAEELLTLQDRIAIKNSRKIYRESPNYLRSDKDMFPGGDSVFKIGAPGNEYLSIDVDTVTATHVGATTINVSSIAATNYLTTPKKKVGTFTSTAVADSTQTVTGVGFQPSLVSFDFGSGAADHFRIGFGKVDADMNQYAWGGTSENADSGGRNEPATVYCIGIYNSAGAPIATGKCIEMTTDGFKIYWNSASAFLIGYTAYQ